jgi:UDP-N-acetylglucosamine 2-epimerase (non-hydrolysing)
MRCPVVSSRRLLYSASSEPQPARIGPHPSRGKAEPGISLVTLRNLRRSGRALHPARVRFQVGKERRPLRILSVIGARPNFVKIAPVHREMERRGGFDSRLVHTGQHRGDRMSDLFFRELALPAPVAHLGVHGGSHAEQTGQIMVRVESVLQEQQPDMVLVVGDVNSALAASLVAAKCQVPTAHIEAGLRSFDLTMPEEVNRMVVDRLAEILFVTERSGVRNLRAEGVPDERIFFVGNVMIDTLVHCRAKAAESTILDDLTLQAGGYALMTVHRPSVVDSQAGLETLLSVVHAVASQLPVVFPMHPRTHRRFVEFGLLRHLQCVGGLTLLEPLGYLDFLRLMEAAALVVTDSGGVQEETTFLRVPCLTLRANTERPATIESGFNRLVPLNPAEVGKRVESILRDGPPDGDVPELWDGDAAVRIVDVLESKHTVHTAR